VEDVSPTWGSGCGLRVRRERDSFFGSFTVDCQRQLQRLTLGASTESRRGTPSYLHRKPKRDTLKRAPTTEGERLRLVDFGFVGFLGDLGWSW
jgi:hypothetical protein